MGRRLLVLGVLGILWGVIGPQPAVAGMEEEAARQLQLAEDDLASGNFERAAASAASVLRLEPGLHEALVVRALALQGLGRLDDAAALLRAYKDLRGSLQIDPPRHAPPTDAGSGGGSRSRSRRTSATSSGTSLP